MRMQTLTSNIIVATMIINVGCSFAKVAEKDSMGLLMKGLYEHSKQGGFNDDPEVKRKADEYIKQYEEMQSSKRKLEEERERVEIYQEALSMTEKKIKSGTQKDCTHEVEDEIMKQYKVSRYEAHQMIQSYDPRAEKIWKRMVAAETAKELAEAKKESRRARRRKNEAN